MSIPTRSQLKKWSVGPLTDVATSAARHADAIEILARSIYKSIAEDLDWHSETMRAATDRAASERSKLGEIAALYDDLSVTCSSAVRDFGYILTEMARILSIYEAPPVRVGDDEKWTIHGIENQDSEQAIELSRLAGLAVTLRDYDELWGRRISEINDAIEAISGPPVIQAAMAIVQRNRIQDPSVSIDRTQTSATAFKEVFGRSPSTPTDWSTAAALNPKSYMPEFRNVDPEIRVVKIDPVPGQGIVRVSQYIEQRDVSNPDLTPPNINPGGRDLGNNRSAEQNFDPENTKVTTYVDYENGIVVMRQNPSVQMEIDGSPGEVKVGSPEGRVWQNPDGSVRIQYDAGNPWAVATKVPFVDGHPLTVNGDLVLTPTEQGVRIDGTRTDYPSLEAYQDRPDGSTRTILIDRADSGSSLGPAMNLPFHHDIGSGPAAFLPFQQWDNPADLPGTQKPSTPFGQPDNPPRVR